MKSIKIAYVLLLCLMASLIFSCAPSSNPISDQSGQNANEADEPGGEANLDPNTEEDEIDISDDLPEDLDYGGYEFGIYTRENSAFYQYIIEEENGEILNDVIYKRTRNVEDRLNILFSEIIYTDANAPQRLLLSGDDAYDIYNSRCSHALNFWLEGLVAEIDDLPHINLDKPYWNKSANESISLNKHQYVAIGAANISVYEFTYVLLFNKQMIKDFGLASPYDLVNSGQWTIDKMDEFMKSAIADVDGNGIYDLSDRYGYVARNADVLPAFWIASGVRSVTKDQNDMPIFSVGDEKFINIFDKVYEIMWDNNAWYNKDKSPSANVPDTSINLFMQSQSLFMDCQVSFIVELRGMETDFGIIPYPKYDEQQESYYARGAFYDSFVVAKHNPDLVRTSAVIEALNSESNKTVIPAYYETCLKTRTSRDEESESMLDVIFDNLVIDLGDSIWVNKIRDAVFAGMFSGNNRNLVSKLESMEKSIQADIEKILNVE
ncbi:MAG: hypothetical protein FWH48_12700 [Oscillospiraceae bacterium]|nr:hypothetical protein [Oscillospiraceae bacterium]